MSAPWAKTVPRRFCWRATQCLCLLHQMAKRPPKLNQRKRAGKAQSNWSQPYRKSAAERGYGNEWRKLRDRIMKRDKRLCQRCLVFGLTVIANEVDHIVPKANGGTDDPDNLQSLCKLCHRLKTAREGGLWFQKGYGSLRYPSGLPKPLCPVVLVAGPPGSGKSTYVANNRASGERVICFDTIAAKIINGGGNRVERDLTKAEIKTVLSIRNDALASLSYQAESLRAWVILSEPEQDKRIWWKSLLNATVIVMATPPDECRRRCLNDARNGDKRAAGSIAAISKWWSLYRPNEGELTIKFK